MSSSSSPATTLASSNDTHQSRGIGKLGEARGKRQEAKGTQAMHRRDVALQREQRGAAYVDAACLAALLK